MNERVFAQARAFGSVATALGGAAEREQQICLVG